MEKQSTQQAAKKSVRVKTNDAKGFPDGGKERAEALVQEHSIKSSLANSTDETTSSTAVAAAKSTAVGAAMDFSADAGMGMEGADKDSLAIPFIVVLQSNSPQCEIVDGATAVAGAQPGKFLNSVTNEVQTFINLIHVAFQRRYLEWAPRTAGGGFRGEHTVAEVEGGPEVLGAVKWTEKVINDKKEMVTEDGNLLKDTRNHFVMAQSEDGSWHPAVFSLASTKISASKRWLSRMTSIVETTAAGKKYNPPTFSRIYKFWTVKKENEKGKFFIVDFDVVEPVSDPDLYASAKAFYQQVAEGRVKVQQPVAEEGNVVDGDEKF
jgi:hypothetical protein